MDLLSQIFCKLMQANLQSVVLRASSGIPASYLTCGSSIIQVMLASFKYLLEHKVLKKFSFIYNSSSNNCLPYVFIQDIVIAKSKKLKKNSQFQGNFTMKLKKMAKIVESIKLDRLYPNYSSRPKSVGKISVYTVFWASFDPLLLVYVLCTQPL